MDFNLTPFMTILITSWALAAASVIFAAPVLVLRLKDRSFPLPFLSNHANASTTDTDIVSEGSDSEVGKGEKEVGSFEDRD